MIGKPNNMFNSNQMLVLKKYIYFYIFFQNKDKIRM